MDLFNVGRDVYRMFEIVEVFKGKVNIVMLIGFYKVVFYDKYSLWLVCVLIDDIVKMMVVEVEEGMDEYNYNGFVVKCLKVKVGIIKVGIGYVVIDRFELKVFEVVVRISIIIGCLILVYI